MEGKKDVLQTVSLGVLLGTIATVILLVVPATSSFVSDTKVYLSFVAALAFVALFLFSSLKRRAFEFLLNPLSISMLVFAISAGLSSFLASQYPVENLIGMGGVIIATSLVAVIGGVVLPKKNTEVVVNVLAITGTALTLSSALQLFNVGPANIINSLFAAELPTTLLFNLTGSSLIAAELLAIILVGLLTQIVVTKHVSKVAAITLPILVIGLGIHAWSLLPGKPAEMQLPSWAASWSIALDAIRSPRSALIGVGPAAYRNVYSMYKPLWVNGTTQWATTFNQASNGPFTILTTMGFIGLLAWTYFAVRVFLAQKTVHSENKALAAMLLAGVVLQLVLPLNVVLITIQAALVAALIAAEREKHPLAQLKALSLKVISKSHITKLPVSSENSLPLYIGTAANVVVLIVVGYLVGRSYMGFVETYLANKAALADNAVAVYEHQQKAVALNPYLDTFRRNYAITNLLIASALSNKTDITEAETEQIAQLLQQAVREARSATLLDQTDSQNWLALAQIYQNMVGISEDATQWAVQSYVSAIETNPTDPSIRVTLGGIFMNQKEYQQAASIFQQTIGIKSDFAPAYYNLGVVLITLEDWRNAQTAFRETLKLLPADSEDYSQVSTQLAEIDKKVAELDAADKKAADAAAAATKQGSAATNVEAETETPLAREVKTPSIIEQNLDAGTEVGGNTESDVELVTPPVQ